MKLLLILICFVFVGCSEQPVVTQEEPTKYSNVPTYWVVLELQKEEERWMQQKK